MNAKKLLPWMRLKVLLRRFSGLFQRASTRHAAPAYAANAAYAADPGAAEAQDDAVPRGCGWFDSSHDLQQGLRVQEHLSADSLARELPLGAWLDLQLSGWRAASPGAAAPAFTHVT